MFRFLAFEIGPLPIARDFAKVRCLSSVFRLMPTQDPTEASPDDLLLPDEVCKMLRIELPTLYRWTHLKLIPHLKISRRKLRFKRGDVEAFVRDRRIEGDG